MFAGCGWVMFDAVAGRMERQPGPEADQAYYGNLGIRRTDRDR
jgi:hypothetical protein